MRLTPPSGIMDVADLPEQNMRWLGQGGDFYVGRREHGIG